MQHNPSVTTSSSEAVKNRMPYNHRKLSHHMELFYEQLTDFYSIENAMVAAIPGFIKKANSNKLKDSLTSLNQETHKRIIDFEKIFHITGKKPTTAGTPVMNGLLKQSFAPLVKENDQLSLDTHIINTIQMVKIYECATFNILYDLAQTLNLNDIILLLDKSLNNLKQPGIPISNSSWISKGKSWQHRNASESYR